MIDYQQIKLSFTEMKQRRSSIAKTVTMIAADLVDAYTTSLQLERPTWKNSKGEENAYVVRGELYGNEFLEGAGDYNGDASSLSFYIKTVVDDLAGDYIIAKIKVSYADDAIRIFISGCEGPFISNRRIAGYTFISDYERQFIISKEHRDRRIDEVCNAIKRGVLNIIG